MIKQYKPDLESFLKTLRREKTNKIPIAELGIHPLIKEKFLGRKIETVKDEIDFWSKAGYDYVKLQPKVNFNQYKEEFQKKYDVENQSIKRNWSSEESGLILNDEDFNNYSFPRIEEIDYSNFEEAVKFLPENFGIIGQYGDIFTMTWELMGFENFSLALFENYDLVKRINNSLGEVIFSMFQNMITIDEVAAIWYSDDIAFANGLIVSPDTLDDLFFPWLKKIAALAKEYNKPLIYHSDGLLYDAMDKIIECGIDVLHPIEPKAMNIVQVKRKYGEHLALIGNIDVDLLSRGSKEEVRNAVIQNIETVGLASGYCVGSGNSIPEYVNFENYLVMIDVTKNYIL
ncbi:MAG: nucleoside 2-deoxyribosyltransferase [Ignavibacterium sp.]|nr:nucleoside 2-deoxyribosyltransferase [Ignavibacterium sp.]MDW8375603.1 uroporphyrinogen decarboxylase family protein [Ignavibacteriales bacterium]